MKMFIMLRRTHERIVEDFKNNNKIINDERRKISDKNVELQKEIKELKARIEEKDLKILEAGKLIEEKDEMIERYDKAIDIITTERDNAIRIQRSETRTRKSKKYKEMERIIEGKNDLIEEINNKCVELQEDLDRTRKELDEVLTKRLQAEKECNCNCDHDENTEEITVFKKGFGLTDENLAEKLNEAMRTEFPELPFTDIEPPIKTEVKDGVIRPVKKQPKNKGKRVNKANKNSKMNNRRKGSK